MAFFGRRDKGRSVWPRGSRETRGRVVAPLGPAGQSGNGGKAAPLAPAFQFCYVTFARATTRGDNEAA